MTGSGTAMLQQTLGVRFAEVPTPLLEKIQQCQDVDVLRAIHRQVLAFDVAFLEPFFLGLSAATQWSNLPLAVPEPAGSRPCFASRR